MNEFLTGIFVTPFLDIASGPVFFAEVVVSGLLAGVMYSMVALGFVLIFKASGVFNFAQGIMVLFAALTLVGLMERGVPLWLALLLTVAVMVMLAYAIERVMLRKLVNQDPFTLLMATIGLNFFLEGTGEMVWGSNVKRLDVGIPDDSIEVAGMLLNQFELFAAVIAAVLVTLLAVLSQKNKNRASPTRGGRRSSGRDCGGHSAQNHLGDGVGGIGYRGLGRGHYVGGPKAGCNLACR